MKKIAYHKQNTYKKVYGEWNSRPNTLKKCEFECCGSSKNVHPFCFKTTKPRYCCINHIFKNNGRKCQMIGCKMYETNMKFGVYRGAIVECCNVCALEYADEFDLKSFKFLTFQT